MSTRYLLDILDIYSTYYFLLDVLYVLTCSKQVYYFLMIATVPMDNTASTALNKIADAITTISAIPEPVQLLPVQLLHFQTNRMMLMD